MVSPIRPDNICTLFLFELLDSTFRVTAIRLAATYVAVLL
jgi:hypothetical protein